MERIFSIFKVYDYKGGELSSYTNIKLDSLIGEILESGTIKHKDIDCWEDLYDIEDENKVREICSGLTIESDIYAGGDGTVMEIYEHKDNRLHSISPESLQSQFADYILKNR